MSDVCQYCGNARSNFEYDVGTKLYYCGQCGRAGSYEQDRTTGIRNFGDEKSKQRDTSGTSAGKSEAQEARVYGALCEVVGSLDLDPSLIQAGMCVFADYQAAVRANGKTLRSRNIVVVAAASVYAASELRAKAAIRKSKQDYEQLSQEQNDAAINNISQKSINKLQEQLIGNLDNLMDRLTEFCEGRGRGNDPFGKQLDDIRKNVTLKVEQSIDDLVRRNKQRLRWPDAAGNAANRLARGLEAQRQKQVQELQILSNGNFSWILFALLTLPSVGTQKRENDANQKGQNIGSAFQGSGNVQGNQTKLIPGYRTQDWELLTKEAGLGSDFLRKQAEELRDVKPALHREVLQALHQQIQEAQDTIY